MAIWSGSAAWSARREQGFNVRAVGNDRGSGFARPGSCCFWLGSSAGRAFVSYGRAGGGIWVGLAGWGGPRAGNAALGSWRHSFSAVTSLIEHGRRELSGVLMAHEGPSFSMRRGSPVWLSATQGRSSAPNSGSLSAHHQHPGAKRKRLRMALARHADPPSARKNTLHPARTRRVQTVVTADR